MYKRPALTLLFALWATSITSHAAWGAEPVQPAPPTANTMASGDMPGPLPCLTPEEVELARGINAMRTKNNLPPIPVTGALSRVAKWHVLDLTWHAPHKKTIDSRGLPCDLHSWSDKGKELGKWRQVCYTSDHKYAKGMWDKPREMTEYRGDGYENIYWTSAPLSPSMAITMWENRETEASLILERSAFAGVRWRAMGVGLFGSYVSVWFGERLDPEKEIKSCAEMSGETSVDQQP